MVLKPGLIQYARRFETIARHAKMSESWLKLCTLVSTLLAIISCAVQIIRKRYRLGWHLKICKNTFCRYTSIEKISVIKLYIYRFKLINKIRFFKLFLSLPLFAMCIVCENVCGVFAGYFADTCPVLCTGLFTGRFIVRHTPNRNVLHLYCKYICL